MRLTSPLATMICVAVLATAGPSAAKGPGGENGNNGKVESPANENGNSNSNNGNGSENREKDQGSNNNSGDDSTSSANPSAASPGRPGTSSDVPADQDLALDAVEDARALPLETITDKVHATSSGDIIDVRLVTVDGFLLYEVKVLDGDHLDVLHYYAKSGVQVPN